MAFLRCWVMGWQQAIRRPFESGMIVLGIGLGVAVTLNILLIMPQIQERTRTLLEHPVLLTMRVEEQGSMSQYQGQLMIPLGPSGTVGQSARPLQLSHVDELARELRGLAAVWAGASISQSTRALRMGEVPGYDYRFGYHAFTPGFLEYAQIPMAQGSWFLPEDYQEGRKVMVLTSETAEYYFPQGGAVGSELAIGEERFQIIGVLEPFEPDFIRDLSMLGIHLWRDQPNGFLPMQTFIERQTWSSANLFRNIHIRVTQPLRWGQVESITKAYIDRSLGPSFMVITNRGSLHDWQERQARIVRYIGILAVVVLSLAAINILNLMLARVTAANPRIGLLRALGSNRIGIFGQTLAEAVILGGLGGGLGLALGYGTRGLLTDILKITPDFTGMAVVFALGLGLGLSLLFGVYPALEAAGLPPVEALRKGR